MPKILIIAGRGRYEDPWHDHAATSHRVAGVLDDLGEVEIRSAFRATFDRLDEVDLLIINSGTGRPDQDFDGDDESWLEVHDAVRDYSASGRGILALHQAANTFGDSPYWEEILGGRWIPGTSMHPKISQATIKITDGHPIVDGLASIDVWDERYSYQRIAPASRVFATQRHDDIDHPIVWLNTTGGRRTVYDALGHGPESYDSPTRSQLLRQEAAWLLG